MSTTISIDFSSCHDVLLRNPDGTLLPMDQPYFESRQINEDTWAVRSDGDWGYLIVGEKEALLLDTGYGAGNVREYCEKLCGRPVRWAANTHEHFDHTANNQYFDLVYMSEKCAELATIPYPSFRDIKFDRNYPKHILKEGDTIDLGGRLLEVFAFPNHAPGSLCYLDRKDRILFGGDEISPMFLAINTSVREVKDLFAKIAAYRSEFDQICSGPGPATPAVLLDNYIGMLDDILNDRQTAVPGVWPFGEPRKMPHFPHDEAAPDAPVIYDRYGARKPDMMFGKGNENKKMFTDIKEDCARVIYDADHIE